MMPLHLRLFSADPHSNRRTCSSGAKRCALAFPELFQTGHLCSDDRPRPVAELPPNRGRAMFRTSFWIGTVDESWAIEAQLQNNFCQEMLSFCVPALMLPE